MDLCFRMSMFLFLWMHLHHIQSNDLHLQKFVSNTTMNWADAVQYCMEKKATLVSSPIHTTQTDLVKGYWTIKQRRLSPWIHVIGCFNEAQIDPSQTVKKTLTAPSVVTCQQTCSMAYYFFFGLQNTSCVCLSDHFSVTEAIDPRLCNTSCSTSEVLNDRGGPGTYSVYKAGDLVYLDDHDLNARYMALKCSDTTRKFVYLQYSSLTVNCQCRRPGTELNDTNYSNLNWKDCYKNCKKEGQYLHGDYDVVDPVSACYGTQTGNLDTWVGIARQNFTSFSLELEEVLLTLGGIIVAITTTIGLLVFYAKRRKRNNAKDSSTSCSQAVKYVTHGEVNNKYDCIMLQTVTTKYENYSHDEHHYDSLRE